MAIFLTEDDVQRFISIEQAIEEVEQAFKEHGNGTAINSSRERVQAGKTGVTMMVAALGGLGVCGFKTMSAGKPMVSLYGGEPYQLLAVLEAGALGQIRTGAASGVATRHMSNPNSSSVGVIGTGFQAMTQLAAICAVRPIKKALAYSRTDSRREQFCTKMSDTLGIQVSPAASAQEAVLGNDIIITITNVRTIDPVLLGDWLEPGVHINAAGANSLGRRELDDTAIARCSIIAADSTDQAKLECADLSIAIESGLLTWDSVLNLGQIVTGKSPGRINENDITLFESQGIALEDVAVAAHIFEQAKADGAGKPLPF